MCSDPMENEMRTKESPCGHKRTSTGPATPTGLPSHVNTTNKPRSRRRSLPGCRRRKRNAQEVSELSTLEKSHTWKFRPTCRPRPRLRSTPHLQSLLVALERAQSAPALRGPHQPLPGGVAAARGVKGAGRPHDVPTRRYSTGMCRPHFDGLLVPYSTGARLLLLLWGSEEVEDRRTILRQSVVSRRMALSQIAFECLP